MVPPPPGMALPQKNIKFALNSLLRDKQRLLDMDENSAKRGMSDTIRLLIEDMGVASGS